MHARRGASVRAFTLIELLVVIAIVTVLIGILLPALGRAQDVARSAACLSSMRSLAQATHLYAQDYAGRMPASTHSAFADRRQPWAFALAPYLGDDGLKGQSDAARWRNYMERSCRCGFDPRRGETPQGERDGYLLFNGSYGLNVYFELTRGEVGSTGPAPVRAIGLLPNPSKTVLFGEVGPGSEGEPAGLADHADHVMAHFWTLYSAPSEVATTRHGSTCGYAFADGHAADLPFQDTFDPDRGIDLWNPHTAH
ncbi:MAG: type II secretion system protein [Phycisphaerales bacterium]